MHNYRRVGGGKTSGLGFIDCLRDSLIRFSSFLSSKVEITQSFWRKFQGVGRIKEGAQYAGQPTQLTKPLPAVNSPAKLQLPKQIVIQAP